MMDLENEASGNERESEYEASCSEGESESETSCSESKSDNNSSDHESDLTIYLSTAYEVLKRIFSFLPLEDVDNAAEAFKSWRPIANVVREERRCLESLIVSDQKYKMTKLWARAHFVICFSTAMNREVEDQITEYMTADGEFCQCLTGAGIIGTVSDISQLVQQKVRVGFSGTYRKFYFSVLRFPRIPKAGIRTYLWIEGMDFAEFRNSCDIPEGETIKCVIILMITEGSVQKANLQKNDFINYLQSRQSSGFALGGSVIDGFGSNYDTTSSTSMIKYIVFYGENVEAASTILTSEVRTLAAVNEKVRALKEMCPVVKRGALFVFRCAGRQRVIRRSKVGTTSISRWEGETIQKYFPGTPITGCFGYGEFGKEFPNMQEDFLPVKKLKLLNWEFSFSTSLVYVGFKV